MSSCLVSSVCTSWRPEIFTYAALLDWVANDTAFCLRYDGDVSSVDAVVVVDVVIVFVVVVVVAVVDETLSSS